MGLWIEGLKTIEFDDEGCCFYYTDELFQNGFLIERNFYFLAEEIEFHTSYELNVHHLTDDDAITFTVYSGPPLESIQEYRVLKDILDLGNRVGISNFEDVLKSFSSAMISASMQSEEKNRQSVRNRIQAHFVNVKEHLQYQ